MPGKNVSVDKEMIPLLQRADMMGKMDHGCDRTPLLCKRMKDLFRPINQHVRGRGEPYFNLSSGKISCFNYLEPFLENTELAFCVWPENKTQKSLSVSGDVVRKKIMSAYVQPKNLAFMFHSFLDNTPKSMQFLDLVHLKIEVKYLLKSHTPLPFKGHFLQPLDQGNITISKSCSTLQRSCSISEHDGGEHVCVQQCWSSYRIVDCVGYIKESVKSTEIHCSDWLMYEL